MYDQTNAFTLYEVGNKNGTLSCPPTGTSDPYTRDADDMSQEELLDAMMDVNDNFVDFDDD